MRRIATFALLAALVGSLGLTPVIARADSDIVTTAAGNKHFSILVKAVKAAGLVETLKSAGPFTVFAPTNAAFRALEKKVGEAKFNAIVANKKALVAILTYHVLPGKVEAASVLKLKNGAKVKTVEGSPIIVHHNSKGVFVDHAKVIKTDIECSNGVIHVINRVILPPDLGKYLAAAHNKM